MKLVRVVLATSLMVCAALPIIPTFANDSQTACDQFAASPVDASRPQGVAGVPFGKIDVTSAKTSCLAAWEQDRAPRTAFQLARALHQDGDIDGAMRFYDLAAAGHHVEANVGWAEVSRVIAARDAFLRTGIASDMGSPTARYNMAVMTRDGDGTPQNARAAIAMFEPMADEGDVDAAYNLGVLYDEGELVLRDVTKARQYYEMAAAAGDVSAKVNLGYLLLEGADEGARVQATALFRSATEVDDDINAGLQLALLLQDGSEAERTESERLVLNALRARDHELGRFLQRAETGLSTRNVSAIQHELHVPAAGQVDAATLDALSAYFSAHM